jgi:hypothetical protein
MSLDTCLSEFGGFVLSTGAAAALTGPDAWERSAREITAAVMPSVPSSWAGRAAQLAALTILCWCFRALFGAADGGEMAASGTETILNPDSALVCVTIWRENTMMAPVNVASASITSNAAP